MSSSTDTDDVKRNTGIRLRLIWDGCVLVGAIWYLSQAMSLSNLDGAFPRLVGWTIIGLVTVDIISSVLKDRFSRSSLAEPQKETRSEAKTHGETKFRNGAALRLVLAMGVCLAYLALWSLLGYILDTILGLTFGPLAVGLRFKYIPFCIMLGIAFSLLMAYLFSVGQVQVLPTGVFGLHIGG